MTVTRDRLYGFTDVYEQAGHPIPPELIVSGDFLREGGTRAMATVLERAPDITAVYCLNDAMAIGAMWLLRERGIDVPGQISVMGFEDIPAASDVHPALSTIKIPMRQMGEHAMRMLLEPPDHERRTVRLPTTLCRRGSTARRT